MIYFVARMAWKDLIGKKVTVLPLKASAYFRRGLVSKKYSDHLDKCSKMNKCGRKNYGSGT